MCSQYPSEIRRPVLSVSEESEMASNVPLSSTTSKPSGGAWTKGVGLRISYS